MNGEKFGRVVVEAFFSYYSDNSHFVDQKYCNAQDIFAPN
jgi:hypothetical protein